MDTDDGNNHVMIMLHNDSDDYADRGGVDALVNISVPLVMSVVWLLPRKTWRHTTVWWAYTKTCPPFSRC